MGGGAQTHWHWTAALVDSEVKLGTLMMRP